MAYNIRRIDGITKLKRLYFFDANIWLLMLKPPVNPSDRQIKYMEFFSSFKYSPANPKIIITSFLLSEIINRYIRDVCYSNFCKENKQDNPVKSYYKQVYRPSRQYKNDFVCLCDDINDYGNFFEPVSDQLGVKIQLSDILKNPPLQLDFNDNYYYLLAKMNGYSIVTDDGDFFVEDVEILTYNSQLIERAKSAIIPKK